MTDLIQKTRKEWCEIHDDRGYTYTNVCPKHVVAALLDLWNAVHSNHGGRKRDDECDECVDVDAALAAITRALEGKP
jgi:hypothetical protein